ncbi:hypothetical protein FN846DRAFT_888458 [Sphaerosporella brunnea]|uniref:Uncharacterized protein n=1 Tax=Sphaerosporella brunnea TaxID=1250544 RepID=A0A5J5F2D7_9PEZI|nr:hypothetical protein FN846DRAFT_888458 [Sphaerosporella brunnea]
MAAVIYKTQICFEMDTRLPARVNSFSPQARADSNDGKSGLNLSSLRAHTYLTASSPILSHSTSTTAAGLPPTGIAHRLDQRPAAPSPADQEDDVMQMLFKKLSGQWRTYDA